MRFDSYHPAINFMFFTAVIACTVAFRHPVFLAISYAAAFAYSVKLNGIRGLLFNLALLPLIGIWTWFYSSFTHFGVTNIGETAVGNMITLESLIFGVVIGVMAAAVLMWMACVHATVASDKVVYLFGRVTPRLSLFLSILLRLVPRIKDRARRISTARKAIGRGPNQGNPAMRFLNAMRLASIVLTWTMENMVETSDSMYSRGYALKGRTAFSIYRFDNRDRSFVIMLCAAITAVLAGVALDQTKILYDPQIILNPMTPLSYVFYTAYAFLCLLPTMLQIVGEWRFRHLEKSVARNEDS